MRLGEVVEGGVVLGGEIKAWDSGNPWEELLRDCAQEGNGDALSHEGGPVYFSPSLGVTDDLADDALDERCAGRAETTPQVERQRGKEVSFART